MLFINFNEYSISFSQILSTVLHLVSNVKEKEIDSFELSNEN